MAQQRAKILTEAAFVDHPRYDIEAHDLAYDFIETEIGHFYFPDNWVKHRAHYIELLEPWLKARARGDKMKSVIAELDELSSMGLRWSDFDEIYFPDQNEDIDALNFKPTRRKG